MGRYESQRAIAARTIYERRLSRKRGLQWLGWGLTRIAGLALTIGAVLAIAWFAPGPAATPEPEAAWTPVEFQDVNAGETVELTTAPSPQRQIEPRRGVHRRAAIAAEGVLGVDPFEGAEVLDVAELDSISQAH